jgi:Bacterial extracellular solute-binding protein
MTDRRTFFSVAGAAVLPALLPVAAAAESLTGSGTPPPEPLVWPVVRKAAPGVHAFDGHTDTIPDVVGRFGVSPSLVIFTEGNHLMALLSDDIVGAFPAWAKAQPAYADLATDNVVVVTLPQPTVVQIIRTGAVSFGNLTLDFSRTAGTFPDIVMGGLDPLQQLRKLGVLEPAARNFSKSRSLALLVRKGNPLGIRGLTDVARTRARFAQADSNEAAAQARSHFFVETLIGKSGSDAIFANEVEHFPGRLGITHRDVPEMIARNYADVGFSPYHLVNYWVQSFPDLFELVPIEGSERFPNFEAFAQVADAPRPRARAAFTEFFFSHARDAYPKYGFAHMSDDEFGKTVALN